jgi:DNA-directed RNA polymerase subunit F
VPQESVNEGRLLTLAEVKEHLEEAERTRGELSYEQKLALDHARTFATRLSGEKARELVERLRKVSEKVSESHAVKIADLLPTHADDVRVIFAKERFQLEKDEMDKILETVQSYLVA